MGLNEVAKFIDVQITNMIDIECFSSVIAKASQYLTIPWHPHYKCLASENDLIYWAIEKKIPRTKLLWYNCSTWKKAHKEPPKPIVRAKFFSVEAAIDLLALSGVKVIRTLGIDGGKEYAEEFFKMGLKPLTNGRVDFNRQFEQINKKVKEFDLDYAAL